MLRRGKFFIAIASMMLGAMQAKAATVTLTFDGTAPTSGATAAVTLGGSQAGLYHGGAGAEVLDWHVSAQTKTALNTFYTYCIDAGHTISPGTSYSFNSVSLETMFDART